MYFVLISPLALVVVLGQVDCALSLVRLGKERQIPGLEPLCDDLVTMETLVYETSCELSLTLRDLQQLSSIHKLRLLMKNVSEAAVVAMATSIIRPFNFVFPFVGIIFIEHFSIVITHFIVHIYTTMCLEGSVTLCLSCFSFESRKCVCIYWK